MWRRPSTRGDGTWRSRTTVAVDVHFGMSTTLDYYAAVHNRLGWDGANGSFTAFTNYGKRVDNAFYSDVSCLWAYGLCGPGRDGPACESGQGAPALS